MYSLPIIFLQCECLVLELMVEAMTLHSGGKVFSGFIVADALAVRRGS